MVQPVGGASLIILMSAVVFGQSASAPPAFEVASVKPHQGQLSQILGFSSSGPRLTLEAYPLKGLIMEAFNLKNYQVSFAASVPEPDGAYYDVVAKAEGDGARKRSEFRQMLQTLLAERFRLIVHREMRERPVYALVVGKSGPKFRESTSDSTFSLHGGVSGRNQRITVSKATMENLAEAIANSFFVDRPVVDRLAGQFVCHAQRFDGIRQRDHRISGQHAG